MELTIVSLELAKKLKDVGFDVEVNGCYYLSNDNEIITDTVHPKGDFNSFGDSYSAPTLELARKWYRVKHNIFIQVFPIDDPYHWGYRIDASSLTALETIDISGEKEYKSDDEALEAALLSLCINKKEQ